MACGDQYRGLLRTDSGRGPTDPCWAFCGINDYGETRDVALEVADEILTRFSHLRSIDIRRLGVPPAERVPPEEWPKAKRDELNKRLDDFNRAMADLPHPLLESIAARSQFSYEEAVHRAWAAAESGLCVMELLDEASTYYTGSALPGPPEVKTPVGDGKGSFDTLVTIGAVAAGLWLWRKAKAAA